MAEAGETSRAWRRPLLLVGKLGLTALVLWLLLRGLDLGRLGALVRRADLVLVGFAVLYTVALNAIKPLRWLWLLRPVLPEATYGVALRSLLVGAGARLVLPSKVGELARVLVVPRLPLLSGVGLTVLDLLMELTAAFLVAIPGALIFAGPELAAAFVLLTLLPLSALLWPHRVLLPLSRLPGLGRLESRLVGIREVMGRIGRGTLMRGVGLSVLLNAIRFGQLYVLFVALGLVPNATAVLCFPLIQLADGFPFTVGGVGVREWLSVQLLPRFGILPEAAVAGVFLQFVISNVLPGMAGGWLLLRGRAAIAGRVGEAMEGLRRFGSHPPDPPGPLDRSGEALSPRSRGGRTAGAGGSRRGRR